MFTGIIEEIGIITSVVKGQRSSQLWVQGAVIMNDLKLGDSVAVNGVCLTVSQLTRNKWMADVMSETLNRSNLGDLKGGSTVNLERAMPANGRFGGHMVAGHIDGTGDVLQITKDENAVIFEIGVPQKIRRYIIEKGSIAIDGISLTVIGMTADSFKVSVIPHTVKHTILNTKKAGDLVNLENDLVGKYIERLVLNPLLKTERNQEMPAGLTIDFLTEAGF
ncbi:riboflavin synthase [Acetobacterium woodii]|uniref:Riboflavin synthase n=1 Tax=Acetobacterium woodii (strain ATCC 29683 / DSM 1030 / JCM 2381 / KCTC 1655 / WB1) TaxID=931626 RepID=H6LEF6_ACEWD|nr:riboflavin synthase [Acetobacterium woodii]AFA46870.1 riboflavin synthase alpha subunit RibE [Acetobacterium woodii DSM 1030]